MFDESELKDFNAEEIPEPDAAVEEAPAAEIPAQGATMTETATEVKKKKSKKGKAAKAEALSAKNAKDSAPGRPSQFAGMKLFKVEVKEDHKPKLNEGGKRYGYFKMIKNGMKFETYMEAGGSAGDLKALIDYGLVRVSKD